MHYLSLVFCLVTNLVVQQNEASFACLRGRASTLTHEVLSQFNETTINLYECGILDYKSNPFRHNRDLRMIILSNNNLRKLRVDLVRGLYDLESFWIVGNAIVEVEPNFFVNFTKLKFVYIGGNCFDFGEMRRTFDDLTLSLLDVSSNNGFACHIWGRRKGEFILEHLFGLKDVETLQLHNNEIQSMTEGIFAEVPSLRHLDLSFNKIERLREGVFDHNPNLRLAKLNGNRLSEVPWNLFFRNPKLQSINLSSNRLERLEVSVFVSNRELERIDLSHNRMWKLYENQFHYSPALKNLRLNNNSLETLPAELFARNAKLFWLDLSSNRIKSLPEDLLWNNVNLTRLLLNYNKIESIPGRFFDGTPALEWIEFKGNALKSLVGVTFPKGHLRLLHLARNELRVVPTQAIVGMESLRVLNLEWNVLKSVPLEIFEHLPKLGNICLGHNHITHLPEVLFDDNFDWGPLVVKVGLNPIRCSCFLRRRELRVVNVDEPCYTTQPRNVFNGAPVCVVDDEKDCNDDATVRDENLQIFEEAIIEYESFYS